MSDDKELTEQQKRAKEMEEFGVMTSKQMAEATHDIASSGAPGGGSYRSTQRNTGVNNGRRSSSGSSGFTPNGGGIDGYAARLERAGEVLEDINDERLMDYYANKTNDRGVARHLVDNRPGAPAIIGNYEKEGQLLEERARVTRKIAEATGNDDYAIIGKIAEYAGVDKDELKGKSIDERLKITGVALNKSENMSLENQIDFVADKLADKKAQIHADTADLGAVDRVRARKDIDTQVKEFNDVREGKKNSSDYWLDRLAAIDAYATEKGIDLAQQNQQAQHAIHRSTFGDVSGTRDSETEQVISSHPPAGFDFNKIMEFIQAIFSGGNVEEMIANMFSREKPARDAAKAHSETSVTKPTVARETSAASVPVREEDLTAARETLNSLDTNAVTMDTSSLNQDDIQRVNTGQNPASKKAETHTVA